MSAAWSNRRSLILLLVLVILAAIGTGIWAFAKKPQTRSAAKLCEQLSQVDTLSTSIVTLDPTTLGPQVAELQRATSVAPADIQAQLSVLANFVQEVADAVRASPVDKKAALTAALAERQARVDEVTAAGQAFESWTIANCGTSLRTTTTRRQ
ncbi:MAG: hypothetical protein QNL59_10950 [Actinomycetota bacterium]